MTPEQFTYWLQGFFELTEGNHLSTKQVSMIREHLQLVFEKVTGSVTPSVLTPENIEKVRNGLKAELDKLGKLECIKVDPFEPIYTRPLCSSGGTRYC